MTKLIVAQRAVPRLDVRALSTALCGQGGTQYLDPRV